MSENIPERMSEDAPERMSADMQKIAGMADMPDRMPE